jgi:RHS repeat-associated protein
MNNDDPINDKFYYHCNDIFSIKAITDSRGNIQERYSYDPYGSITVQYNNNTTGTYSSCGNPWYFTGRRLDPESGLLYYRSRMYSPILGRFISRDPWKDLFDHNKYLYVKDNPAIYVDPHGLRWIKTHCRGSKAQLGASFYLGIGGKAEIGAYVEECDCCNSETGEVLTGYPGGYLNYTGYASGEIGIGIGSQVEIWSYDIGFMIRGPQIELNIKPFQRIKECNKREIAYEFGAEFNEKFMFEVNAAIPVIGIGALIRGSAAVQMSGGIGGNDVGLYGYFRLKSGVQGRWEVRYIIATYFDYFNYDERTYYNNKEYFYKWK